jgi:hypothetical protein
LSSFPLLISFLPQPALHCSLQIQFSFRHHTMQEDLYSGNWKTINKLKSRLEN